MAVTFGFQQLWQAYRACRRGKRGTANAHRYELRLLDNLVDTATALASRTYTPSRSLCFAVSKPKAREIHAADFADRVVHHLRERLQAFEKRLLRKRGCGHTVMLKAKEREALRAALASYLGHFRHANGWRLACSLWQHYPWLSTFFDLRQDMTLQPLWEPASVASLRSQWRHFKQRHPDTVIRMQVGNRIERYNADANPPNQGAYRHAPNLAAARPLFDHTASLPIKQLDNPGKALRKAGLAHAFIAEEGYLRGGMKRRVLRWLWRPEHETTLSTQEITQ